MSDAEVSFNDRKSPRIHHRVAAVPGVSQRFTQPAIKIWLQIHVKVLVWSTHAHAPVVALLNEVEWRIMPLTKVQLH